MDIKSLSERTGIPVRQIRYVLDHELAPHRTWFIDESAVGRARTFDEITGIIIACAVYLLDAGYKRDSIRDLITTVSRPMPKSLKNPLRLPIIAGAVMGTRSAKVQFADGRFVRWIIDEKVSDWYVSHAATQPGFVPKVTIEIDIGKIRDLVLQGTPC
ncbi:MAG: hypothetical protein JWP89_3380 [Schlesneria sp.]|nr:hypothetical protein [Schlesneria sp.]